MFSLMAEPWTGRQCRHLSYITEFTGNMPVEEILWDPRTVDPLPTRHARAEAPTEPPAHLAAAELVYICKGSNLPPALVPS